MGGRNHHSEPFDEATLVKLDLYRRYVRAWLPVFLNSPKLKVDKIQIFDFFAGPGRDVNGKSGSPLIALEEIKDALHKDHRHNPEIHLYLNEMTPLQNSRKRYCDCDVCGRISFRKRNTAVSFGLRIRCRSPSSVSINGSSGERNRFSSIRIPSFQ